MKQFRFEAEIVCAEDVPHDVVRERVYGSVRVSAEWPDELAAPEIRLAVEVLGDVDAKDAPAFVELFFHDLYLLLNLASPGSFAGTIAISGDALRVRELTFRAYPFALSSDIVPLPAVIAWYDALRIGTRQRANDAVTVALFELLHLARIAEDEEVSIIRLARAAEALIGRTPALQRLFEIRDEIVHGLAPVHHPMHDDGLDASVHDATEEWIEVADAAAAEIVAALQSGVRRP